MRWGVAQAESPGNETARAYFAKVARNAAARPEVSDFVAWLKSEAARDGRLAPVKKSKR